MFPNPQDALPLPTRPDLDQYKKLAKDLVRACKSDDPNAINLWSQRWIESLVKLSGLEITPRLPVETAGWLRRVSKYARHVLTEGDRHCALADAQFVIARSHGFESWPKFSKHLQELQRANSHDAAFEAAADAIVTGDLATLERLLRQYPGLARRRSTREHGATLLHYTSANGVEGFRQKTPQNIVAITRLLLDSGADVDATCGVYGGDCTTLGLAATSVHPEVASVQNELLQLLLDRGASLEQPGLAGNRSSAIRGCLSNGRGRAAEFLASRGARMNLEEAAGVGRLDVVQSFFNPDGSLKPTATQDDLIDGFAWACEFGHTEVVHFLLDHGIAAAVPRPEDRQSGLHWAAHGAHMELVKLLLSRGAPVNLVETTFDGTPLSWALYGWANTPYGINKDNYYEVVALLVRAGAKVDEAWLADDPDRPALSKLHSDPRMLAALKGKST